MRYRANKKVSRWHRRQHQCRHQQDPHQKQYVPLPFGGGHNDVHTWNSLQGIRHNHWTMKYRSQWPTFILGSNVGSYQFILRNYDVYISSSLQDIRQNHWTVKYRWRWTTFIFRSSVGSYWFIIPNNDVHTWNSLQGIRQNHWTLKYRSRWPTFRGHASCHTES